MAMTPTHLATGMAIGAIFSNPVISIPIAFLSHFVFDLYPEWGNEDKEVDKVDIATVAIEIALGLAAVNVLFLCHSWEMWVCAAAANFVDGWDFIYKKIKGSKMWFCHGGPFPVRVPSWCGMAMRPLQTAFLDFGYVGLLLALILKLK